MLVRLSGSWTEVRLVQPSKAWLPMEVTPSGMVTLVMFSKPEKALPLMVLTPFLMTRFVTSAL